MVQTWFYQGWAGYKNAATLCQTWFCQGGAGYKNDAARGGAADPRMRVTHFQKKTKHEIAMPFG